MTPAPPTGKGGGKKAMWWAIGAIVIVIAIAAAAGGGGDKKTTTDSKSESATSSSTDSSSKSSGGTQAAKVEKDDGCGSKATDDCTPHLGTDDSVRVDALVWRISSARVTKTIGDQQYGLGAKASGRFIVLKLKVHSDKDESADLTDNTIKLEVDGNTYDADNDGTVAAIGSGQQPFFFDTIGPDADKTGTVVFDVPKAVLAKNLEVRFNELGFGETHGYLKLPSLSLAR